MLLVLFYERKTRKAPMRLNQRLIRDAFFITCGHDRFSALNEQTAQQNKSLEQRTSHISLLLHSLEVALVDRQ